MPLDIWLYIFAIFLHVQQKKGVWESVVSVTKNKIKKKVKIYADLWIFPYTRG